MATHPRVRWGILGTANIAQRAFLPALRAAGGQAYAVAGRNLDRTQGFALANEVELAHPSYAALLDDEKVHAVYIPLPNSLHAEWTIRALAAGKAVLCEKPLCATFEDTERVLAAAGRADMPLWEAFVFPFHPQTRRVQETIASGVVGHIREIHSEFHFKLRNRNNVRLSVPLGGGALLDVGCYPIRFAQVIFDALPLRAAASVTMAPEGVDEETRAVIEYSGGRSLMFSCGMARESGTFTRLIGDEGELRLTNPFHGSEHDTIEIHAGGKVTIERVGLDVPSFTPALQHIHSVLAGTEEPRNTALTDSMASQLAYKLVRGSSS